MQNGERSVAAVLRAAELYLGKHAHAALTVIIPQPLRANCWRAYWKYL